MLPSSVRRVVSAAPQSSLLSNLAPTSTRTPAALTFCCNPRGQQRRRYSSSKPSSPNDSPKGIPDGQVTATPSQSSKQSREKRRSKAKEWTDIQQNLPSVPSTQHVPQEAVALSTFFSLHRPMSVTHSFPKTVTDDAFAQIFAPRTKNNKYSDVMSTISRTVDELEQPMENLSLDAQQGGEAITDANGESIHKIDLKHPDGTNSSVYVQLNAMSGQFLPFRPPPLPQSDAAAAAEVIEDVPQHRVYKAMLTLEETTDENGQIRIMAHSPLLIQEAPAPRTFLERMAQRQIRWREGQNRDMLAISVRRQKKLKMKKKKYKKLMKRTRNIRRKLDRV
ncbi:uncharacterized protein F4822DRAFT_425893 [Hypoxylon trugodes]|uniref:uncharacterized protein n=1 Tax=Hypoxylon trugodes TaxID=326681 RepID=UPI002195C81A|nr:uncharacterized protein F4822DRAFT_425893 [Hypoxylon trugodes]KAI1392690.1 hypothetical protein F4822DRAFT_425893 [Hypoxylon trugodes]